MLERKGHSVAAHRVMCFITQWLSKRRRERGTESCNQRSISNSSQQSNTSSHRSGRRHGRRTNSERHTSPQPTNARDEGHLWNSSHGPPTVIRSRDGEHGYEYSQLELRRAQEWEQNRRKTVEDGCPPNIRLTLSADGIQHYPVQMNTRRSLTSRTSSNCRNDSGYARGQPPPYSQCNTDSSRNIRGATSSKCRCGLYPTHSEIVCPIREGRRGSCEDDRRGSCPSYSSHRSEPPPYEMDDSNNNIGSGERSNLPSYSQL
ncbi:uncharacterized protein [Watersipora subatra]|uniref:uncharacterized protein n=1 Tax=Watersipora subatra TaxID=2589382 RepID=UPI00355B0EF5